MVEMKLQLLCLALFPVSLLVVFSTAVPASNLHAFSKRKNGIEQIECYTMVNWTIVFTNFKMEKGVRVFFLDTQVIRNKKCCPGYKMKSTHCLPLAPVNPCYNLSCKSEPNARCTVFKKCGQEIALFLEDGVPVEKCHEPGYLSILSCSGVCVEDPCRTAQCPGFNSNEVICFTTGCDCRATWIRGEDGAEVNCQTGMVLTKQDSRRRKREACN